MVKEYKTILNGWKTIGYVGVDSGTLIIGDPCYLDDADDWNPEMYNKWICGALCDSGDTQAVEINDMCLNQAVAFSSGFGDGVYEVKACYKNYGTRDSPDVRIKEVRVILIGDNNETEKYYKHEIKTEKYSKYKAPTKHNTKKVKK